MYAYGVGHASEGVSLLVRMGPHRILLDCGLTDTDALIANRNQPPADLVLCTHAHPDHARGLLALHQAFPKLPIYASEVTAQLLPLNWPTSDLPQNHYFCQALPLRSPVEFRPGLGAQLYPAGHLPGASAILLSYAGRERNYSVLYTGDFLLSNSRLVEGLHLEELRGLGPDVLILEGSYGTVRMAHRRSQENQLAERINAAIAQRRSVLLPVSALGLGQEMLMLLRSHHHFTGRDIDIWVDESVAVGCDAYLELLPQLPSSVQNFAKHQPLFWDERVRPRVRRLARNQRGVVGRSPCIVITEERDSLAEFCSGDTGPWLVLFPEHPGYHSALDEVNVQASVVVESYLLAEHCDGPGTTQLIHNLRPQHVIFVHGSPAYLADLTNLDELRNRYQLHLPAAGMGVELPIGETFMQPEVTEAHYEGELVEQESVVTITLPNAISLSSRWHNFADTGLVVARWQGEELVLRGLSQRELLSQGSERDMPVDVDCCGRCVHYRGQRCWNSASPLFGFKVTPDGYCPVFEPVNLPISSGQNPDSEDNER
ncbi:MBL fold metallo-hydrolase [Ancylothrix sp. C2]|uniref:MBL fold metallo-hydrolase n=1 Tax=Ancylothrix sp. D3o TaxID=2953691 RepID=UPI0021BB9232|nr:MBL fold metallo-hydrolase [Ancylothrix sp. D3o]MCT7950059.1 MBL fold metallo-hydrolase [Ancylothrix sp. D3o]